MKYLKWYLYYELAATAYTLVQVKLVPALPVNRLPSLLTGALNNFTGVFK